MAHEVWIERDGNGPARIYLGEPAEAVPEGGDPEFPKLKTPTLFSDSRARRSETHHALDLGIVPLIADGDQFAVLWQGHPLPGANSP